MKNIEGSDLSKRLAPLPKAGIQERQNGFGLILYEPEQRVAALLNLTATVIWRYLGSGRSIASIVDAFAFGFASASAFRTAIEADVVATLAQFEANGFLSDQAPPRIRVSKTNQGVVNEYGLPEISATYVRPTVKLYTIEQLQAEFGEKKALRPPSRFSDTWNPDAGK